MRSFRIALCLLLAFALASCARPARKKIAGAEERVLATVDGKRITEADFLRALGRVPAAYREKYTSHEGKRQLLRSLIEDEIFYKEGRRLGIGRSADVKAEVDDFRKRIVRERISDDLKKNIRVSENDVERYYRENREKYTVPEKLRLSVIMIGLSKDPAPEEVEQAEEKAKDIIKRLNEGDEFEWLAIQVSEHSSGKKGGDLGFLSIDEVPPDFAGEASAIPAVGEVSGPVLGKMGIYIVKLTGKQPEGTIPFDEAKGEIERLLLKKAHDEAYKKFLEKLEDKADIEVYDRVIDRIGLKRRKGEE